MAKDKQAAQQAQYDSPWKQAIEVYFPDFMTFFFPGIYDEIDWNKEPVFMDNALEKTMQYVSSIERIGFKKGKQQGMQHGVRQGIQQGMQQGRRQGMQQGESTMLVRQMERRFGHVSEEIKQKIEAADSDTLLEWGEKILSASTIDDVFRLK